MILALLWMALGCAGGDKAAEDTSQVDPDPDPDPEACIQPTLDVQVGTGSMSYTPLNDGDPVTLVHGPQGGWHILGAAYMTNFDPVVNIHYTVVVEATGAVVADNNYRVQMKADGDCAGFYPGMYGYLDVREIVDGEADTPPELLGGEQLRLTMDVTDLVGRAGTDSLLVVGELDPHDL